MSDFVRAPLMKKLNANNYLSRIESLERGANPSPSARVQALGEIAEDLGTPGRGNLQVRADGMVSIARLNRILLFSVQATPTIPLPEGCLTGSNIVEVVLTGQFFQNTGSNQTMTPSFYIGISGSETLVTSNTALTVSTMAVRKAFMYTVRVSAAPQGGNYVQCDELFQVEAATAGVSAVVLRTTRSTNIIDINNLGDVNSCFMRIANGATPTFFKIFTNTVSVRILDAEPLDEIHWYSQPTGANGSDALIYSAAATTNYGSLANINIGERNDAVGTWRTCIKFSDLDNFLSDPDLSGFVITEAYLYLTVLNDFSSNARTFELFRLLVDFDVAAVTWNIRKTATNWGAAGGLAGTDYDSTPMASCSFSATEAAGVVKSFVFSAGGIVELQKMIDGTYTNNGFFLKAQTETNDGYTFESADSATADLAPVLYIIGYKP